MARNIKLVPVRTLLFSTLYPSEARPNQGLFVETRLRKLLETGQVEARVVSPVPWFPLTHSRFGTYAQFARTPHREQRHGIDIVRPRYPLFPKVGMTAAPALMAAWAVRAVRQLLDEGFDFDLIDAHYFYPDGVAAALIARWLGKPLAITARGSDLNLIARYWLPRLQMQWAARRAAANIAVSRSLADILHGWHIDPTRVHVLRNGVDCGDFSPVQAARAKLGLTGQPVLLTVGNLVALKRQVIALDALHELRFRHPQAVLVVVGDGPERRSLEQRAQQLGLTANVRFAGAVPQVDLPRYYSAADVMLLPSQREGWPNVILECLACGTPVVAARVGGVPEILVDPLLGEMVDEPVGVSYAEAVDRVLGRSNARDEIRRHAQQMDWRATSEAQLALFRSAKQQGH